MYSYQLKIAIMVQRSSSRACEEKEERYANYGYEIKWQKEDEFGDLAERERRVDSRNCWFAKHFYSSGGIGVQDAGRRD